jgi:putative transposase
MPNSRRRPPPTPTHARAGTVKRPGQEGTLNRAYATYPERFARRPRPPKLPEVAWINQPTETDQPQPTQ